MKRTLALSLPTLALLGLAASGAHAQVLVQYASPAMTTANPPQAATTTDAGITASALDVGSFFGGSGAPGEANNSTGVFAIAAAAPNQGASPDFNTALSSGAYITFTVSPSAANTALDLSSITLPVLNQGGNTARTFSLVSSVDNFGSVLTSVNDGTLNYTFGSAFQNLTAPVEFRLVVSGPQSYQYQGFVTKQHFDYGIGQYVIDSAPTLNGTVAPIAAAPEPSQTAALGLGVMGLAGLILTARRRRAASAA